MSKDNQILTLIVSLCLMVFTCWCWYTVGYTSGKIDGKFETLGEVNKQLESASSEVQHVVINVYPNGQHDTLRIPYGKMQFVTKYKAQSKW